MRTPAWDGDPRCTGEHDRGTSCRGSRGYRRDLPDDIDDYIRGLVSVNRNIAIHGTRIIDTSNDDFIYAVDARTGELVWETEILDYTDGTGRISFSSSRVLVGRSDPVDRFGPGFRQPSAQGAIPEGA